MVTWICDDCGTEFEREEGVDPIECPECGSPNLKDSNRPGGVKPLPPGTIGG